MFEQEVHLLAYRKIRVSTDELNERLTVTNP